jgi:hypothetical protein
MKRLGLSGAAYPKTREVVMENWSYPEARYRLALDIFDVGDKGRTSEPVEVSIGFDVVRPPAEGILLADESGAACPFQIVRQSVGPDDLIDFLTLCFIVDVPSAQPGRRYFLYASEKPLNRPAFTAIEQLQPITADGFRRLDTGTYVIELCAGTGKGSGGSKWGIRHFEHKAQGLNLIANHENAFGGVYGPFFTPENGLVNPPAHAIANIEPVCEGPIKCEYRIKVEVPTGLRAELAGKKLESYWAFFARSHWFVRSYFPDDYETVIDGKPCRNRITVGDEIESGKKRLLLSTYKHHNGTAYRAGDLYANILLQRIEDLKQREPEKVAAALKRLGIDPSQDPRSWHWDNYWRLFCVIEGALPEDTLREEVERIWKSAHEIVWQDTEHNLMKYSDGFVDVNREPQQTIFPLNAQKTVEFSPETGFAFLRYVNRVVPRMQIVQRFDSGWVNWGTNGENEYPEMPSGSTIWSAYGRFSDFAAELDCMENPVAVGIRRWEKYYPL